MEVTVIGVYDDQSRGQSAKHVLLASGFSHRKVQLNPDPEEEVPRAAPPQLGGQGSLSTSIGNIFRSLLGGTDKSTYSNVYAEAVRSGSCVLTVDTDSDEQRERVKEVMRSFGPVDIEERSEAWIRGGWRGHDPNAQAAQAKQQKKGETK
jgi:hypothetical protein